MKRPTFTLRDMFWMILVIAILLAWWARESHWRTVVVEHVKVIRFFGDELGNQDYLIDFSYRNELVLLGPKGPRARVEGGSQPILGIDEGSKELIFNELGASDPLKPKCSRK